MLHFQFSTRLTLSNGYSSCEPICNGGKQKTKGETWEKCEFAEGQVRAKVKTEECLAALGSARKAVLRVNVKAKKFQP